MKLEGLEYSNKFELNPKEMQNLLKQEHLLSKENRRKSMIQEKLFQKRHLQTQSKQRTLQQFFAPEEPKDIQMKENVQMVEENKEEEIRGKRYPNLNQHFKIFNASIVAIRAHQKRFPQEKDQLLVLKTERNSREGGKKRTKRKKRKRKEKRKKIK